MDFVTLIATSPHWFHVLVNVLTAIWVSATVLANTLRAIPEEKYVALDKAWPAFGHFARSARKLGVDVWPFVVEIAKGFVAAFTKRGQ